MEIEEISKTAEGSELKAEPMIAEAPKAPAEEVKTQKAPKAPSEAKQKAPKQAKTKKAKDAAPQPKAPVKKFSVLLFNKWDTTKAEVKDLSLKRYVNLEPVLLPRSEGRFVHNLHKEKVNIVERLINKLMIPGHRGKRHKVTSGQCPANKQGITLAMKKALEIIETKTKQNPVQTMIGAIENAAMIEEIAAYRLGGIIARKAVVVAPQRRLDVALRHLAQGIYRSSFNSKLTLPQAIADELIAASNNDAKCFAIRERQRLEKEAEGAR